MGEAITASPPPAPASCRIPDSSSAARAFTVWKSMPTLAGGAVIFT
jgi:hypothetical protein